VCEEFRSVVGEKVADDFIRYVKDYGASRLVAASPLIEAGMQLKDALKDTDADRLALRSVFEALMLRDHDSVAKLLKRLVSKILSEGSENNTRQGTLQELLLRIDGQFPGDVGCFCVLMMNYVCLQPGQSMFLAANEPHAYLSGDCVECMATSDNVVRAGLTPKPKDVATLVSMLTFNTYTGDEVISNGEVFEGSKVTRLFDAPVPEFSVLRTVLSKAATENIRPFNGPSVLIVIEGCGTLAGMFLSTIQLLHHLIIGRIIERQGCGTKCRICLFH
jgi:mannose-6-phosphate isomerase